MNSKIRKKIRDLFWTRWFLFFLVGISGWVLTWYFIEEKTFKIAGMFGLGITELLYVLKVIHFEKSLSNLLIITSTVLTFFIAIGYTSIAVSELIIGIYSFVISLILIIAAFFVVALSIYSLGFWRSKSLPEMIYYYIMLVFFIILLFSISYSFAGISTGNEIRFVYNSTASNIANNNWDFFYFSATVFYSSAFGDYIPFGISRVLVIIEVIVSFIIHSIVIAIVVSNFKARFSRKHLNLSYH